MKIILDEMVNNLIKAYNTDGSGYVIATSIKGDDVWNIYANGSMGFRIDVICEQISNIFKHVPSRVVCDYVNTVISGVMRKEIEEFNKREAAEK